ncbi:MAG TPA: 5-(carboxyamino)imidazole ribonucleotide synthase [Ktedonobacterales bacterium]
MAFAFPARLGILGGGQLARMLAEAASTLGVEVVVMEREPDSPAGRIAAREITGPWDDTDGLRALADESLAITLENEFVDVASLRWLEAHGARVFPTAATLARCQDKHDQKVAAASAGIAVTHFRAVAGADDIIEAAREWGWPLVLKARHNSYDGYGNVTVRGSDAIAPAFEALGFPARGLYVEAWVPFVRELAVIVARGHDGAAVTYPVAETVQEGHICRIVRAPAEVAPAVARLATQTASQVVEAFDGVGVFGVELFQTEGGGILFNEIAPRPHNSGHYTIEACVTSQFEQAIRITLGLPLGSAAMVTPVAVMVNVLGRADGSATSEGLDAALAIPGAHVHLYGKLASRTGRKMGHVTALGQTLAEAEARALAAADALRLVALE